MLIRSALICTLCFASQVACADLLVIVRGEAGSGTTDWEFSGEYDATATSPSNNYYSVYNGGQATGMNLFDHSSGDLSGEIASDTHHDYGHYIFVQSGRTSIVTGSSSGVHNLNGVFLDSNGANGSDDFAWYAAGIITPETLTFSGSAALNEDITTFGEGATEIVGNGDWFTIESTSGITPLTMIFRAVPEPGGLSLLLCATTCFIARRRSRCSRLS